MAVDCPFCKANVEPVRDAVGRLVCPRCNNTGQPVAVPPPPAPPGRPEDAGWIPVDGPAPPYRGPTSPAQGATAAMILGIVGLVLFWVPVLGLVLAIVALVVGYQARRRIRQAAGRLDGEGMATAGVVMGWIGVAVPLIVIVAAVLFVLVTRLGGGGLYEQDLTIESGDGWLQGFPVGDGATYEFEVRSLNGEPVTVSLREVDDWIDPDIVPGREALWEARGTQVSETRTFPPGDYALVIVCEEFDPCRVYYRVEQVKPEDGASSDASASRDIVYQGGCGEPSLPDGAANRLPRWRPANVPEGGAYILLQGEQGDYVVGANRYLYVLGEDPVTVTVRDAGLSFRYSPPTGATGPLWWNGEIRLPSGCPGWSPGAFTGLTRAAFSDPETGGIDVGGDGRGCNTITGVVVVDEVRLDGRGEPVFLSLRFEQHCEGGSAALMGQVVWDAAAA
jgi:hypothetical protein